MYSRRDTGLSLKSKGLLSMMLSLPEEWNYTTRGLAAICKEGGRLHRLGPSGIGAGGVVPDEPASTGGKEHERIETKNNGKRN